MINGIPKVCNAKWLEPTNASNGKKTGTMEIVAE